MKNSGKLKSEELKTKNIQLNNKKKKVYINFVIECTIGIHVRNTRN